MAKERAEETKESIPFGLLVLFNLGLRIGELCALKWRDIERINNKMNIHIQREMTPIVDDTGHKSGYKILDQGEWKSLINKGIEWR